MPPLSSMLRTRRPAGALEGEVRRCLIATGSPMTVAEVRSILPDSVALTTVATVLTRDAAGDPASVLARFVALLDSADGQILAGLLANTAACSQP